MPKTFCDRCGKEITKDYGRLAHSMLYARIILFPGEKHEEWYERKDKYICPECEDSFIRWLMNPETEDRR